MLIQRMNNQVLEDEWKGIIYYVYENDDAKILEEKIIDYIRNNTPKVDLQNK